MLQEPLQNLLLERKPDCIVHDVFHRWSADAIDSAGIPRITFNGNGCFAHCVRENMERYEPHEKVTSDLEPFIVPGLPDGIELTMCLVDRQNVGEMAASWGQNVGEVAASWGQNVGA